MQTFDIFDMATGEIVTSVRAIDKDHALDVGAAQAGFDSISDLIRASDDERPAGPAKRSAKTYRRKQMKKAALKPKRMFGAA